MSAPKEMIKQTLTGYMGLKPEQKAQVLNEMIIELTKYYNEAMSLAVKSFTELNQQQDKPA